VSKLQQAFERLRKPQTPQIGFTPAPRERPKAMLLGVLARDREQASTALRAGADLVIIHTADVAAATAVGRELRDGKHPVGVWLPSIDGPAAAALVEAGVDFVACALEHVPAGVIDPDQLGLVVPFLDLDNVPAALLRALGPLEVDALLLKRPAGEFTLRQQAELVRLATLSGVPLLVISGNGPSEAEVRALRDSGAGALVLPEGSGTEEIAAAVELLRRVGPRKRSRREGAEIALVPALSALHGHVHEEEDDEEEV